MVPRWSLLVPAGLTAVALAVRLGMPEEPFLRAVAVLAPLVAVGLGLGVLSHYLPGKRLRPYWGRAVDIFVRPLNEANNRKGWSIAQYLVAHADRLHVQHVIFDGKIWSSGLRSSQGWREYDPGDRPGDRAVLEHRDHVHVDVYEGD